MRQARGIRLSQYIIIIIIIVAAAEQVRLEPVLEHRHAATKLMSHRMAGRSRPFHRKQDKHDLRLLIDSCYVTHFTHYIRNRKFRYAKTYLIKWAARLGF